MLDDGGTSVDYIYSFLGQAKYSGSVKKPAPCCVGVLCHSEYLDDAWVMPGVHITLHNNFLCKGRWRDERSDGVWCRGEVRRRAGRLMAPSL